MKPKNNSLWYDPLKFPSIRLHHNMKAQQIFNASICKLHNLQIEIPNDFTYLPLKPNMNSY